MATLFSSQQNVHDEWNLQSLLDPSFTTDTHHWVVALVCHKGKQHTRLLVEGIRKSGQRFLQCYHLLVTEKGNAFSGKARIYSENWAGLDSTKDWHVQAYEITSAQGEALCHNIQNESENKIDIPYAILPFKVTGSKKVNATTWCCNHIIRIGVPIESYRIPGPVF